MNMFKEEYEDNDNAFGLAFVKKEIEEIKCELPNQFKMSYIEIAFVEATNAAVHAFYSAFLYFNQRQLHSYKRCLIVAPIKLFEGWHSKCVDALGQLGQNVANYSFVADHVLAISEDEMKNRLINALRLMNIVSQLIRPIAPRLANEINLCYKAVKFSFTHFFSRVRSIPAQIQDEDWPIMRLERVQSPVQQMLNFHWPDEVLHFYQPIN